MATERVPVSGVELRELTNEPVPNHLKRFRVPEMESALAGSFTPDAIAGTRVSSDFLLDEIDASAEYRAHLISVMARRAVAACA